MPYELEPWVDPPNNTAYGIHTWTTQLFGDELSQWLDKVSAMRMSHVTTLQTDLGFMQAAAQRGLAVYSRPFYRASDEWGDDGSVVEHMLQAGLPARIQLYNEPDLIGTEWPGGVSSYEWAKETWGNRWMAAATYIFNRGGWPGIQTLDPDWFRYLLERIKNEHSEIIKRLWVCVHNYPNCHPPIFPFDNITYKTGTTILATIDDPEGMTAILQPLAFDHIAMDVLDTHLPVVCGEGGYSVGDNADNRYPIIDEALHAQYTVVYFDMFRTGVMPNGDPLPDWWKAVTPWLLSSLRTGGDAAFEQNAWYGAWHPDRQLTIDAVKAIPTFVRQYGGQPIPPEPIPTPGGDMEYHFSFKDLHDANPTEIGNATSEQIDIPNVCSIQFSEKGILVYQGSAGTKFIKQTLPPA